MNFAKAFDLAVTFAALNGITADKTFLTAAANAFVREGGTSYAAMEVAFETATDEIAEERAEYEEFMINSKASGY